METTGPVKSHRKAWFLSLALLVIAVALATYSGLSHAATPAAQNAGSVSGDAGPSATDTASALATATPEPEGTAGAAVTAPSSSPSARATAGTKVSGTPNATPSPTSGGRSVVGSNPSASQTPGGTTGFAGIIGVPQSPDASPTAGSQPGGSNGSGGQPTSSPTPAAPAVITGVQMSTSLAADGSAANPQTSFNSATDKKVIAVVTLKDTVPGTTIKYVHINGSTFTQSATFTFKKSLNHFYVQYAASAGKNLTPGHFSLRYYLDGHEAGDISWDIT